MAQTFPYTVISCPCSDASKRALTSKRLSKDVDLDQEIQDSEDSFDPRHPRAAFSLFPPEHLLYCEECHDIKCPRCVSEEIASIYCPDCLFESSKGMARTDGCRCPRNCVHCPLCTSQMSTTSIGDPKNGPFILTCTYCMWNTLDIGIKFDKGTGIRNQLSELAVARGELPKQTQAHRPSEELLRKSSTLSQQVVTASDQPEETEASLEGPMKPLPDATIRFHALKQFYKDQITESSSLDPGFSTSALDMAFSSPSSVQRIMNLYMNKENSIKKAQQKITIMREAQTTGEGLALCKPQATSADLPNYNETTTLLQRDYQNPSFIGHPDAQTVMELRPMPTIMRSKRSKRCATCKHILTRPEVKVSSARYRIKLIALAYIPFVTIKPLPISGGLPPPGPDGSDIVLSPGKPIQFIMTLRNPLFESVNVSLGSPSVTPGKHGHRVTILCPQFQIGKNSDAWDDALNKPPNRGMVNAAGGEQIAGKLYDQGRNWASVVLEIVPASIVRMQDEQLNEDEDVIEVPIRVRLEWQVTDEETGIERRRRDKRLDEEDADDGKRELSYWMVVGIGRVSC